MIDKNSSSRRRAHTAGGPLEQLHTQDSFDVFDLLSHGCARYPQCFGRSGEASGFGDSHDRRKVAKPNFWIHFLNPFPFSLDVYAIELNGPRLFKFGFYLHDR